MSFNVYLDVCCLNRPFDDQTQPRVHLEAEAVLLILTRFESGDWEWTGGEVMDFEVEQAPDPERRQRVRLMFQAITHRIIVSHAEEARARELEVLGFHAFDALHLACAETGTVDVFLTTDDRLLRRAVRLSNQLRVRVENPLTWINEVSDHA